MLDTVLLEVKTKDVPRKPLLFHSSQRDDGTIREYLNPDAKFVRSFGYTPSYTIVREPDLYQANKWNLRGVTIHASLPKLLYGTNYYEVDESDYDTVIEKLVEKSKFVGLPFEKVDIEEAILKQVDFCFNFRFPDYFPPPTQYLNKLSGLDAGKQLSKRKHSRYVEKLEGASIGYYNSRVGVGFYDKKAQLENQAKTREETQILVQMDLKKLPRKILRMEVRWQNQRAVKQHLYTLLRGQKNQPRHLYEVFDNKLVQKVLMDMFKKVTDTVMLQTSQLSLVPVEDTFKFCKEAGLSEYDTLALIGQAYAIQSLGASKFKEIQDTFYSRQTRFNTKKRFEKLLESYPLPICDLEFVFAHCKDLLEDFVITKPQRIQLFAQPQKDIPPLFAS